MSTPTPTGPTLWAGVSPSLPFFAYPGWPSSRYVLYTALVKVCTVHCPCQGLYYGCSRPRTDHIKGPYWLVSKIIVHILIYGPTLDIDNILILIYGPILDIENILILIYLMAQPKIVALGACTALKCGPRGRFRLF